MDAMKEIAAKARAEAAGKVYDPEAEAQKKIDAPTEKKRFSKEEFLKQKKANEPRERDVVLAGIIEEAREIATKKDAAVRMMFLKLADFSGSIEAVVFPRTYEQFKSVLAPEKCVALKGKTSNRNGTPSLIVDTVKVLKKKKKNKHPFRGICDSHPYRNIFYAFLITCQRILWTRRESNPHSHMVRMRI